MNTEPVAIVNTNCENNIQWYDDNPKQHNGYFLYTHPVKEFFEDEPQAEELHEIMQNNTHPVEEQDEAFDRTASHMAGEYVSYKAELTDEEINKLWAESHEDGIAMQQGFTT